VAISPGRQLIIFQHEDDSRRQSRYYAPCLLRSSDQAFVVDALEYTLDQNSFPPYLPSGVRFSGVICSVSWSSEVYHLGQNVFQERTVS
jgi:hypothetical protein